MFLCLSSGTSTAPRIVPLTMASTLNPRRESSRERSLLMKCRHAPPEKHVSGQTPRHARAPAVERPRSGCTRANAHGSGFATHPRWRARQRSPKASPSTGASRALPGSSHYCADLTNALCSCIGIDLSRETMAKLQTYKVMPVVKNPRTKAVAPQRISSDEAVNPVHIG